MHIITWYALAAVAAPVELENSLKPGTAWRLTEQTTVEGALGSSTREIVTDLVVRDGGTLHEDRLVLDVEVVAVRSEEILGGQRSVWDSATPTTPTPQQALEVGWRFGDTYTATVAPAGDVQVATDPDAPLDRLRALGFPVKPKKGPLPIPMSDAAREAFVSDLLWTSLPARLEIGERWTHSTIGGDAWTWTLTDVDGRVATFELADVTPPWPWSESTCTGRSSTTTRGGPRTQTIECEDADGQRMRSVARWERLERGRRLDRVEDPSSTPPGMELVTVANAAFLVAVDDPAEIHEDEGGQTEIVLEGPVSGSVFLVQAPPGVDALAHLDSRKLGRFPRGMLTADGDRLHGWRTGPTTSQHVDIVPRPDLGLICLSVLWNVDADLGPLSDVCTTVTPTTLPDSPGLPVVPAPARTTVTGAQMGFASVSVRVGPGMKPLEGTSTMARHWTCDSPTDPSQAFVDDESCWRSTNVFVVEDGWPAVTARWMADEEELVEGWVSATEAYLLSEVKSGDGTVREARARIGRWVDGRGITCTATKRLEPREDRAAALDRVLGLCGAFAVE